MSSINDRDLKKRDRTDPEWLKLPFRRSQDSALLSRELLVLHQPPDNDKGIREILGHRLERSLRLIEMRDVKILDCFRDVGPTSPAIGQGRPSLFLLHRAKFRDGPPSLRDGQLAGACFSLIEAS
jgi:hypothetical protein